MRSYEKAQAAGLPSLSLDHLCEPGGSAMAGRAGIHVILLAGRDEKIIGYRRLPCLLGVASTVVVFDPLADVRGVVM